MKVVIDTDKNIVLVDGEQVYEKPSGAHKTDLAGLFEAYLGTKEYEGIVSVIQKWYYGTLVKDSWCATSVSYFANLCGLSEVVGKYENVDKMKEHMNSIGRLDCTKLYGGGHYKPKRNDIVFMSSRYEYDDCTHVMVVSEVDNNTGAIKCVGGNTGDAIAFRNYNYLTDKYIVAFGATS